MPGEGEAAIGSQSQIVENFCASAAGDKGALSKFSEEVLSTLQNGNLSPDFAMQMENSGFSIIDSKVWNKGKIDPASSKAWQGASKLELEMAADCKDSEVAGKIKAEEIAKAVAAGAAAAVAIAVDIEIGTTDPAQKLQTIRNHAERKQPENQD